MQPRRLRMTPDEIVLDGVKARLREGGSVDAALHILHWEASAVPAAVVSSKTAARKPA